MSLREAVAQANATAAADRMQFATNVEGQNLKLAHGEMTVTSDLVIDGNRDLNKSAVTIDGNYQSRIFHVTGDADLELAQLTLTHGQNGSWKTAAPSWSKVAALASSAPPSATAKHRLMVIPAAGAPFI